MSVSSYFNEKYADFTMLLFNPRSGAKRIVKKADFMAGVRQLAGIGFFTGIAALFLLVTGWLLGGIATLTTGAVINAILVSLVAVAAYFLLFIPVFVGTTIAKIVWFGFMWALAKVLGGKGKFGDYFGAMTFPCLAVLMVSAISMALFSIVASVLTPFSPGFAGIVTLVGALPTVIIAVYGVWLFIAITRESQQLDTGRAAVAVVIPVVVVAIAALVIAFIVSFLMSSLGSLMASLSI